MKMDWRDKSHWLAVAFATFAILVVLNRVGEAFGLDKTSWAAWVQAIGSIGAIVLAILISKNQNENQRQLEIEAERRERIRRLKIIQRLISPIVTGTKMTCSSSGEFVFTIQTHAAVSYFEDWKNALQSLPVFEIPDATLVFHVTTIVKSISNYEDTSKNAFKRMNQGSQFRSLAIVQSQFNTAGAFEAQKAVAKAFDILAKRAIAAKDHCDQLIAGEVGI